MLIVREVPKPVMKVAGIVMNTGGDMTKSVMPTVKIVNPIQLALLRPNRCAMCGLAQPAQIDENPIAVPCKPAIVSDVP